MKKVYQFSASGNGSYCFCVRCTALVIMMSLLAYANLWARPNKRSGTDAKQITPLASSIRSGKGSVELACTMPTFGSLSYSPSEIYQGNPESLTSTITGLIPNVSQTFTYSIDGVAQTPVTVTSDADGAIINPLSKFANLVAALSSVGTHVATITSITIDGCTLQLTTNNSATLIVKPAPDLSPVIYVAPSTQYGPSTFTVVVDVFELNGSPTNPKRALKVYVNKQSLVKLTFDDMAMMVGGKTVQNSAWSFDDSDEFFYIISTNTVISGGDQLSFGLLGELTPNSTSGIFSVGATIIPLSGGELKLTNNIDVDRVRYFAQK